MASSASVVPAMDLLTYCIFLVVLLTSMSNLLSFLSGSSKNSFCSLVSASYSSPIICDYGSDVAILQVVGYALQQETKVTLK